MSPKISCKITSLRSSLAPAGSHHRRFDQRLGQRQVWLSQNVSSLVSIQCHEQSVLTVIARDSMGAALFWLAGVNFVLFFARNVEMIVAGTVMIGLSWGGKLIF